MQMRKSFSLNRFAYNLITHPSQVHHSLCGNTCYMDEEIAKSQIVE